MPADNGRIGKNLQSGFTLIELVIIIVVLGIVIAVAIVKYQDIRRVAQESVVRSFGASLKEAASSYLIRSKLENSALTNPTGSFWNFVGMNEGASSRNTIVINNSIRSLLANPAADVASPDYTTITLQLKGGAVAVFHIDPATGAISETFTGF